MKYSKKLMKVDLDHNRLRKEQVEKNLERLMYKMKKIIKCRDDLKLIHSICHRYRSVNFYCARELH